MKRIFILALATAIVASAQRAKPAFDPDTKEGLLIEHIQQESDPVEKLHYLEQFAAQFPSHPAAAWVYDQLQPALFEAKDYEGTMRIGGLRISIEPENIEAAKISLRAAETLHNAAQMIAWADKLWPLAEKSGAADARQTEDYADFCAYTGARQLNDPNAKIAIFERLESHKSTSDVLRNLPADFFEAYHQLGDAEKAGAMAQRALTADPENVEMLLAVAEYQFHKGNAKARPEIVAHTTKAVEILLKKPHPPQWTDADWEKKKSQMLGLAYYLGGISASMLNNWGKADQMLRGAIPLIHDNGAQESAVLYHLGMANYRLAEAGTDRTRPVDAVKFLRRCATIKGPYQDQAAKYVESIRSEYSLP